MTLEKNRNIMICEYPVVKDPSMLIDNRGQVIKMAEQLEMRLKRVTCWKSIIAVCRSFLTYHV